MENRLPFRNLGTKGDEEGVCQDGLHHTAMTNSPELLLAINNCIYFLSTQPVQPNPVEELGSSVTWGPG